MVILSEWCKSKVSVGLENLQWIDCITYSLLLIYAVYVKLFKYLNP